MTTVYIIQQFEHDGEVWQVVRIGEQFFARRDGSDTGPYATFDEAKSFVTGSAS